MTGESIVDIRSTAAGPADEGKVHKNEKNKSLVVFFVLLLACAITGLDIIQIFLVSMRIKISTEKSYKESCEQVTAGYSRSLANDVGEYKGRLDRYVTEDIVAAGDETQIVQWLRSHADIRSKDFNTVFFCGEDGISYDDAGMATDIADKEPFKAIMKQDRDEYVSNPDMFNGEAVTTIVRAVKHDGRTIGFFGCVIPLKTIQNTVSSIKLGNGGYALLLSGDGTLMSYPDTAVVMKKNLLTDSGGRADIETLAKKMTTGESGIMWTGDYTAAEKKNLVAYNPVRGTPWSFAFSVPETQVYASRKELVRWMVITVCVIGVILILYCNFFIIHKLRPLGVVEKAVNQIASGSADLSGRINVKTNDEIGVVVSGFNRFTAKLQSIMKELKILKDDLDTAGDELKGGTDDTAAAVAQISAKIEASKRSIENQSAGVEETAGAVNEIVSNIASLEHMIESQAAGVTEASAAVEQMIGNIKSVDDSVEKMAGSFISLEQNAVTGTEKQQDVDSRIKQIENESEMLHEANSVIAGIAQQTNLLAMNAAIEAAHAGESGKGFSVVADEIRKLSETSSAQSKTISEQLKKIQNSISGVVAASDESGRAFSSVSAGIHITDGLVKQIRDAMREQQEGSKQLTEVLHSMNDSTSEVRTASSEMAAGSKAILDEVKNLQEATAAMKDDMAEMNAGAEKIQRTGTALTGLTDKVRDFISRIGNEVDQFKV